MKSMHDMFFHAGIVLRIYPSDRQKEIIRRNGSASRFIYNRLVAVNQEIFMLRKSAYLSPADNARLSYLQDAYKDARHIKNAVPFLFGEGMDSDMVLNAIKNYRSAWDMYRKVPGTRPPSFHKKGNDYSYKTSNHYTSKSLKNGIGLFEGSVRFLDKQHIHLPVLGRVRFKGSKKKIESLFNRTSPTRIGSVKIWIDCAGDCFVSLALGSDEPFEAYYPKTESACGIDMNLSNFLTDSEGNVVENPRYLKNSERKLIKAQRKLSNKKERAEKENRKFYESKGYQEQRLKVAEIHRRISRQRLNFQRTEADKLVKSHDLLSVEDLKVKNLLKNHRLAKAISDVSWGQFLHILEQDCNKRGKLFIRIDPKYTTQTCSACGNVMEGDSRIKLGTEEWTCPKCGAFHIRDYNASVNIRNAGLASFHEAGIALNIT